ncbi:hypothetical protein CIB48_g2221 [Xylaria polymorpha]|nr:hypothetical protein CIB48_g2221 [Xylaria polymorpha]
MSSTTPSNDQSEQPTFKERLDEVARQSCQPASSRKKNNSPGVVEKVAEYVPAASGLLGTEDNNQGQHEQTPPKGLSGPPHRPEHDDHIAEFVREQHRSKRPDGSLGV